MDRLRSQYTLGYYSSNPGETGSFHQLLVRFANDDCCPGCLILARTGYYDGIDTPLPINETTVTTPPRSPQKTDELLIHRSIQIAGEADLELDEIQFNLVTSEQNDSHGQPEAQLNLHIDPAGIDLSPIEGRNACRLIVTIFYVNGEGKVRGSEWRHIEKQLSEEENEQLFERGISFTTTVPLKAKKQRLKIVVYDARSDNIGSKIIQLNNSSHQ